MFAAIREAHRDVRFMLAEVTALAAVAVVAIYTSAHAVPSPIVELFVFSGPLIFAILWLHRDAHRTGVAAVTDLGYFLLLAWPLIIPWYVLKTRGRAGWPLLIALFAVIGAGYLSVIVAAILTGRL